MLALTASKMRPPRSTIRVGVPAEGLRGTLRGSSVVRSVGAVTDRRSKTWAAAGTTEPASSARAVADPRKAVVIHRSRSSIVGFPVTAPGFDFILNPPQRDLLFEPI
jgi:hypothetical protein